MNKTLFALIFLLFAKLETRAQFYTIGNSYCNNKATKNQQKCDSLSIYYTDEIETKTGCIIIDSVVHAPKLVDLLMLYNSVSFPLKKIHVTSPFGMRFHPIDKVWKLHNGIDLSAKKEEVYAVLDGVVERTGYNSTSGNFIVLKHVSGITTSYCHLSKNLRLSGDLVKAGDIVAISGNTGKSTNFHLHFVVRKDGKYMNPTFLIKYIESVKRNAIDTRVKEYLPNPFSHLCVKEPLQQPFERSFFFKYAMAMNDISRI